MRRALLLALALALSGCAASVTSPSLPPTTGAFDYQLGGPYPPPDGVTVVVRDSTAEPAEGVYSICYLNGFQTQPGAEWPDDLVLHNDGERVVDPEWPDEFLLDGSTDAKRAAIGERLAPAVDGCAESGFDAVEFDNLDSWTRSDGLLDEDDNVALAEVLVDLAHAAGLAAGQKNTPQLGERGPQLGFDFAIVEECARYDECAAYTDVYGDRVYAIEYDGLDCSDPQLPPMTVLRDLPLVPAGAPDYAYETC